MYVHKPAHIFMSPANKANKSNGKMGDKLKDNSDNRVEVHVLEHIGL